MSDMHRNDRERLDELLADRALFGLEPAEQRELDQLLARTPESDDGALERVAAKLARALEPAKQTEMPAALRDKLDAGAKAYFSAQAPGEKSVTLRPVPKRKPRAPVLAWFAAAAAVVLALIAWWPRASQTSRATRDELIARAGTLRVDAKGTELAKDAGGDVVWSNETQQGYLRLANLPVNDPSVQQYQLWIFDEDQEHPIDGGVFDVAQSGEVVIPIDAKLRVRRPKLFAVTLEKPGGVVVSDQKRIALVAAL